MRRTARVLVGVGVVGALLALGAGGAGGREAEPRVSPVAGREYRISGPNATEADKYAAVAWNQAAGEYLVVWEDGRNSGSGRGADIYGRRVGPDGAPIGGDIRISGPGATAEDETPAVVWSSTSNGYLVVWSDSRAFSTRGTDIYGRRLTDEGAVVGNDFRISGANATASDEAPAVAWSQTTGQFLVVWQDDRNAGTSSWDVYGRRVGAGVGPGGVFIGEDFRISGAGATSSEFDPAVAWNATADQYLVVWNDYRNTGAGRGSDIYGRRLAASGAAVGGDFRICGGSAVAWEYEPAVAWNDIAQQYLVVWNDYRNTGIGRGSDIYGKRVGAGGALAGSDFRISGLRAVADEEDPAVAWNEAGNHYLVVWADKRNVGAARGSDVYGRLLAADLAPVGSDFRVCGPNATQYDLNPALVWNGAELQYLIVWSDFRNAGIGRDADIYGRRSTG